MTCDWKKLHQTPLYLVSKVVPWQCALLGVEEGSREEERLMTTPTLCSLGPSTGALAVRDSRGLQECSECESCWHSLLSNGITATSKVFPKAGEQRRLCW